MATRREIFRQLRLAATELYGEEEARQIAEMIITSRGNITRNQLLVEPNEELIINDIDSIIADLRRWRPVQYIIRCADFMDMSLEVCEGVLIPRPETEELVEWIVADSHSGERIVDVGTGSGCIAIALARAVPHSEVWAMDISPEALAIARRNGAMFAPNVHFIEGDAIGDFSTNFDTKVDIVVSNPPYIPAADRTAMRPNVTEHEPSLALFVPDDDPLRFYRAIARTARGMLTDEGRLYFEIYEELSEEMVAMLRAEDYDDVVLRHDFRDKPRMICARRSLTRR